MAGDVTFKPGSGRREGEDDGNCSKRTLILQGHMLRLVSAIEMSRHSRYGLMERSRPSHDKCALREGTRMNGTFSFTQKCFLLLRRDKKTFHLPRIIPL